jgi:phenylalanyl-tRNA synthetase beta chain
MKISLQWLSDYIDIKDDFAKPDALGALLTAAGIEVEGVQNLAKTFDHVVVGEILVKGQHPNADRLTLCQVSTGEGVVHQIVCGAKNHNQGDRIVVALPGAVLPGDFVIKRSKIRDVESGGMLCSEKELGFKSESEGILILPEDAPIGKPFAKYMGLDDILFELKVTPNRADCLSHFGLAREIGALRGREVKFPKEAIRSDDAGSTFEQVKVELKDSGMCPRYAGRGVRGVKVGASPDWLKKRLESVGITSINNVVDITNFVMMELGQPLHAFDVREIRGGRIVIDRAVVGEKFTTLDGTDLILDGSELTIRDSERAVALAGIVGGKNSGIQDDTSEIFIESAYFAPAAVRRTARKFGVETDSSYRFARGTNPEAVPLALERAVALIQQVAGGIVLGDSYDLYPQPLARAVIEIKHQTVEDRLGYPVPPDDFKKWMQRLGCGIDPIRGDALAWQILPPMFRWDLNVDMDLVEEYARLNGYQHIPETLPAAPSMPAEHDLMYMLDCKIRRLLQGEGCLQAVNFGFISNTFQERVLGQSERLRSTGLEVAEQPIKLVNPLNEELNVMRTSLVPWLVKNVQHNSRQGNPHGRLFELGFGHYVGIGESSEAAYAQQPRLGFAFWGEVPDLWRKAETAPIVFQLKATAENLLRAMGIKKWRWQQPAIGESKQIPEFLHPSQAAILEFEGKPCGFIGTMHPSLADELKIRESVALAEFNLERLLSGQPRLPKYQPISKMPAVDRDIALLMPKSLAAATVEAEIRKVGGELMRDARVFDVFEGGSLAPDQKSVAFRLLFQAQDATLEDQKVNELRDKVVAAVSQKFGVSLRQ